MTIASSRLQRLLSSFEMGGGDKQEHLLCTLPFPEPKEILDRIRKNYPHCKVTYKQLTAAPFAADQGIPDDLWRDVTILATLSALPPKVEDAPNLELLEVFSAGTNHLEKHPIYTSSKIPIASSSGIHGPTISEWVILTMLVSTRHYHILHQWQVDHKWGPKVYGNSPFRSLRDQVGQRLGVLGYGSIGRQAARVCQAMGMDVVAYTASPRETPESKKDPGFIVPNTGDPDGTIPVAWYSGKEKKDLHNFLAQDLDFLIVSVPLTKATTHLLGKEEFDVLSKNNTFVTNISRGQIIDQGALIDALSAYDASVKAETLDTDPAMRQSRPGIRGAALDVTDPEPLPEDHPLWDAPNCIITPHISGLSVAYSDRAFQVLEMNLERKAKGEKLVNIVDRERGY